MTIDIAEILASHEFGPKAGDGRPLFVAIAGGSGSGKTTIARSVADLVGKDKVVYLQQDAYYRDNAGLTLEERSRINYDHPDSFELTLMIEHLDALRDGLPIDRPVYDFATHRRTDETITLVPQPAVIVEGILVLSDPDLRSRFDLRVYIDTDADLRLIRRLNRDIVDRGRTLDSVLTQYEKTVRPMHDRFVEPSKRYADIIIPEGINAGAIGTVSLMIQHFLDRTNS
ncbi:MAG: uridine kinase [Armatimonadetes bacterium]|nr:MAG: uridine kinase [Armatimonadota bacterium]